MIFSTYRRIYNTKKLFLLVAIILGVFFFFLFIKNKTDAREQIIFVIDVSQSMNVQDIIHKNYHVSRLDAAKLTISGLVTQTKKPFMRGVVIYSSVAKYLVPPTQDKQTLLHYLASINTSILPGGGSNPEAVFSLLAMQNKKISQTIIRHTDGEWEKNNKNTKIKTGIKSSSFLPTSARVIGWGTNEGGVVKDPNGTIITHQGNYIVSKRNDKGLEKLASYLGAKLIKKETTKKIPISLDKQKKITTDTKWRLFVISILAILGSI